MLDTVEIFDAMDGEWLEGMYSSFIKKKIIVVKRLLGREFKFPAIIDLVFSSNISRQMMI